MKFLNKILKTVGYDPDEKAGEYGTSGSEIDNTEIESEPNKYQANQNIAGELHPDGGVNTDLDARTTMRDIQDFHTNAVQDLLGNPSIVRPAKNNFRNIDRQLESQYFGNLETR